MTILTEILRCPSCKGGLTLYRNCLKCTRCSKKYLIISGVPIFKAGLYKRPVVRVRKLSEKQLNAKIKAAQSGKFYRDFLKQVNSNFENYKPTGILQSKLFDGLIKESNVGDSRTHLDWATGRGALIRRIIARTNACHIVTLDLDIQECAALQKYLKSKNLTDRVMVVCGDTRDMPFKDGSFDTATTLWGLDEQRNPEKAINETLRVVKKNGKFALSGGLEGADIKMVRTAVARRINRVKRQIPHNKPLETHAIEYVFARGRDKTENVVSYIISGKK